MEIIDGSWNFLLNRYKIRCECGMEFVHKCTRRTVECPKCYKTEGLAELIDRDAETR